MGIYWKLIWAYIKIGIFGFGGGYAMLSLVERIVVSDNEWISEQMFTDIVAISQMTPGPIGINSATYIGYVAPSNYDPSLSSPLWGILGSLLATLAVTVIPFFMVIYLSHFIRRHHESGAIKAVFGGLKPVVVGLIASAAIMLMNSANFCPDGETKQLVASIVICLASFCLVYFPIKIGRRTYKPHPILVIVIAGITGFLLYGL